MGGLELCRVRTAFARPLPLPRCRYCMHLRPGSEGQRVGAKPNGPSGGVGDGQRTLRGSAAGLPRADGTYSPPCVHEVGDRHWGERDSESGWRPSPILLEEKRRPIERNGAPTILGWRDQNRGIGSFPARFFWNSEKKKKKEKRKQGQEAPFPRAYKRPSGLCLSLATAALPWEGTRRGYRESRRPSPEHHQLVSGLLDGPAASAPSWAQPTRAPMCRRARGRTAAGPGQLAAVEGRKRQHDAGPGSRACRGGWDWHPPGPVPMPNPARRAGEAMESSKHCRRPASDGGRGPRAERGGAGDGGRSGCPSSSTQAWDANHPISLGTCSQATGRQATHPVGRGISQRNKLLLPSPPILSFIPPSPGPPASHAMP